MMLGNAVRLHLETIAVELAHIGDRLDRSPV